MDTNLIQALKILVFASILFVWVVRYANIVEEFKIFGYPAWIRDLVGILKISFAIMIMNETVAIVEWGLAGIILLMTFALITHFKIKNPIAKMLPSFTLLSLCVLIFSQTYIF